MNRIFHLLTVFIFILNTSVFGIGTQFLSIPSTALELAVGINPVLNGGSFSNPSSFILDKQNPDLFFSHGSWLAGVTGSTIRFSRGFTYGTGGFQIPLPLQEVVQQELMMLLILVMMVMIPMGILIMIQQ